MAGNDVVITVNLAGVAQITSGLRNVGLRMVELQRLAARPTSFFPRVSNNLSTIRKDIASTTRSVLSLRNAIIVGAAGFAGKAIIGLADDYTRLNARIGVVSTSAANQAEQMRTVLEIAQSARVPLDAVGLTYSRIAINAERLGVSQAQVASITETVSKALTLSGATAEEAAGGMTQLTQALSKGKLDGDELRSVFENMPLVVKAMEDATGKARGELYKLASQGKITAEVLIGSILKAAEGVNAQFDAMPRTVGQAATQLANAFEAAVGGANASSTATIKMNEAIDRLRALVSDPGFQAGMARIGTWFATAAEWAGKLIISFAPAEEAVGGFTEVAKTIPGTVKQFNTEIANTNKLTREQLALLGLDKAGWAENTTVIYEAAGAYDRLNQAARTAAKSTVDGFLEARTPLQEYQDQLAVIAEMYRNQEINANQAARAGMMAAGNLASAWTGVGTALEEVRQMTSQALSEFSSAVADMVVTGENNFKQLITSLEKMIVEFLVKQAVQMFLQILLNAALPGSGAVAGGGIFGAIGGLFGFAQGGPVKGYASGGSVSDTVPAMLTPGEFVVNRRSAQRHMGLLHSINAQRYASGGMVGGGGGWGGTMISQNFYAPVYADEIGAAEFARKTAERIDRQNRRRYGQSG